MPPIVKDAIAWRDMLLEHRRRLFERLLAEFPEVVKAQQTQVAIWRTRLRE
jgi:hypothetical protein